MKDRLTLTLGFLGAFQDWRGGSWEDALRRHTSWVFPSRARRAAFQHLRGEIEQAPPFETLDLRMAIFDHQLPFLYALLAVERGWLTGV